MDTHEFFPVKFYSFDNKDSVYFEKYYRTWKEMNKHVNSSGSDPLIISKLVFKIINSKNPKIHYKTGTFFQKFSIILKRILPDSIFLLRYALSKVLYPK